MVIIALGMKEDWKRGADEVFREGAERGAGRPDTVEQYKQGAFDFLAHQPLVKGMCYARPGTCTPPAA